MSRAKKLLEYLSTAYHHNITEVEKITKDKRYIATQEGMKKGYWKVKDTTTGKTVESGIGTKSVAVVQADKWNQGSYETK